MKRTMISTNTPWESAYGYSRAVRIGPIIEVAGTVAANEDGSPAADSVYEQTMFILRKIERALQALTWRPFAFTAALTLPPARPAGICSIAAWRSSLNILQLSALCTT